MPCFVADRARQLPPRCPGGLCCVVLAFPWPIRAGWCPKACPGRQGTARARPRDSNCHDAGARFQRNLSRKTPALLR